MRPHGRRDSTRSAFPVGSPSLAVEGLQVLVGFVVVGKAHLGGVPLQLAFDAQGYHAEQHPLDKRAGHIEVRASRLAAFAGADPVVIVPRGAAQNFLREVIILHLVYGDEPGLLAVGAGGDHALLADEEAAVGFRPGRGIRLERLDHRPVKYLAGAFVARHLRCAGATSGALSTAATRLSLLPLLLPLRTAWTRHIAEVLAFRDAVDLGLFLQEVIPEHLHRRHVPESREIETQHALLREHEPTDAFLLHALDAGGRALAEIQ